MAIDGGLPIVKVNAEGQFVKVAGYFVYVRRTKGGPSYEKYDAMRESGMQSETKKRFEAVTVAKFPLTEAEYGLSLEVLARLYPCPDLLPKP